MTKPQIILDERGNPAFAVIPWREFNQLTKADTEFDISDEDLYDQARIENEESFPIEVLDRLLTGENAIRVYRNHRNLTQKQLAQMSGINTVYLSQIERGKRTGSTKTLQAIAKTLNVDIDSLI